MRVSTEIEVRGDVLRLNPELPQEKERLDMHIRYRGHSLDLRLMRDSLRIRDRDANAPLISLCVNGEDTEFVSGTTRIFRLTDETPNGRISEEGSDQLDANDRVTAPTVAVNPALNHTE